MVGHLVLRLLALVVEAAHVGGGERAAPVEQDAAVEKLWRYVSSTCCVSSALKSAPIPTMRNDARPKPTAIQCSSCFRAMLLRSTRKRRAQSSAVFDRMCASRAAKISRKSKDLAPLAAAAAVERRRRRVLFKAKMDSTDTGNTITKEARGEGAISFKTYKTYVSKMGSPMWLCSSSRW